MKKIASFTITAATLLAACSSERVVAPDVTANLGTCTNLTAPAGTVQLAHVFAKGVQVYRWDGQAWVLITPSAVLTADAGGRTTVGLHYAGPTWEGISGGKVVGTVVDKCTPDANAIPWLLLSLVADQTPGVFQSATFIQRLNTTGGKAPANAGAVGEVKAIAYSAEYFFYRPQ